jgi:hypothetical protein
MTCVIRLHPPWERDGGNLDATVPDRIIETGRGRGQNQNARNRAARSQVSKENHTDPPSDRHGGRKRRPSTGARVSGLREYWRQRRCKTGSRQLNGHGRNSRIHPFASANGTPGVTPGNAQSWQDPVRIRVTPSQAVRVGDNVSRPGLSRFVPFWGFHFSRANALSRFQ